MAIESVKPLLMLVCLYGLLWCMDAVEEFNGKIGLKHWSSDFFLDEFDKKSGSIRFEENHHIKIICPYGVKMEDVAIPFNVTKQFKYVTFNYCLLPTESYATAFETLRINITDTLEHLNVNQIRRMPNFTGIHLKRVILTYNLSDHGYAHLDVGVMDGLSNVTEMRFQNDVLPQLPASMQVEKMSLVEGRSEGLWGGCTKLRELNIAHRDVRKIAKGWLSQCTNLTIIKLYDIPHLPTDVLGNMLKGAHSLRELHINSCRLQTLDEELKDLIKLQLLNVANNKLKIINIPASPSLRKLHLTNNNLERSFSLSKSLALLPVLEELLLYNNPLINPCKDKVYFYNLKIINIPKLEYFWCDRPWEHLKMDSIKRLSLGKTATKIMCFRSMKLDSLEYLDYSDNNITIFDFGELPNTKVSHLKVFMSSYPVREVLFEKTDYEALQNKVTVYGLSWSSTCDCEHAWLVRAVREERLYLDNVGCRNGTLLNQVSPEALECSKFSCADNACTCRVPWHENATVARCGGALRAMPSILGLRALHAPNNLVETFTAADLPDTLLFLDLSGNRVSRLDAATCAALFSVSGRRVRLAGNPLICDCDSREFIHALQTHYLQVEDYKHIKCANEKLLLQDVDTHDLCVTFGPTAVLAFIAALVGLSTLITGLYYRYGIYLKVCMYARGWCLCCVLEEELDADRPYDAFVSFSHFDEDFVVNQLMYGLEKENKYKICIHLRDWMAGDFILTQITRSVQQSRRTIIVLSRNFVQSVWGLVEFRMAHVSAMTEGRVRIIIIVIDDVIEEEELDDELRTYLRNYTYLKWGERNFWDKIRYALPHRVSQPCELTSRTIIRPMELTAI